MHFHWHAKHLFPVFLHVKVAKAFRATYVLHVNVTKVPWRPDIQVSFHIHARTGYLLARSKSCGSERCRPTVLYPILCQTGVRRAHTLNSMYYGEVCFPPIRREATEARTYLLESDVRVQTMDAWAKATSERTAVLLRDTHLLSHWNQWLSRCGVQLLLSSGSVYVQPWRVPLPSVCRKASFVRHGNH